MSKKSTIQQLPSEVREYLNQLLRGNDTQLQITDAVNEQLSALGLEVVISKSAVNRYAIRMEQIGKKVRETREISQMWVNKFGSQDSGKLGHLINEIIRTLAFEKITNLDDNKVTVRMLGDLALMVQRLEQASAESEKRERQITESAKKEAVEKMTSSAKKQGISADMVDVIRQAMQ